MDKPVKIIQHPVIWTQMVTCAGIELSWIQNNNLASACKDINGNEEALIYGTVSPMTYSSLPNLRLE